MATAEQRVRDLQTLVDDLTARRDGLHANLSRAQLEFDSSTAAHLQQANEELVLAALHAQGVAETAVSNLAIQTRCSQRDALTGTPNRQCMLGYLEQALAVADRDGARLAVLFVDIDNFKQINDRYGHALGDAALQLVARRLEQAVGDPEAIGRHGGEEFVVLLTGIQCEVDAAAGAATLLGLLAAPSGLGDPPVQLSASVGIALFPQDGNDALTLIHRADTAMYRSKRLGPGGFAFCGAAELHRSLALAASGLVDPQPDGEPARALSDDLREANEQLLITALTAQQQHAQTAQMQLRQDRFMAIVAHELRNPLTPILAAAALLGEARMTRPLLARMQLIIEDQVAHMTRLIDDLLDRSSASAGKLRISTMRVELGSILEVAIAACQPAIERRKQRLTVQLHDRSVLLQADAARLIQVFSNLLDNASKYTPAGGAVALTAAVHASTVDVRITDNGNGIASEDLPRIFELYMQDLQVPQVHGGGLGIGLAVVRELVEAHGGSVTAYSAGRGLGSEFVVQLPLVEIA